MLLELLDFFSFFSQELNRFDAIQPPLPIKSKLTV